MIYPEKYTPKSSVSRSTHSVCFTSHLDLAELFDSLISSLTGCFNLPLQILDVRLQLLLGGCSLGSLLTLVLQLRLQLTNLWGVDAGAKR